MEELKDYGLDEKWASELETYFMEKTLQHLREQKADITEQSFKESMHRQVKRFMKKAEPQFIDIINGGKMFRLLMESGLLKERAFECLFQILAETKITLLGKSAIINGTQFLNLADTNLSWLLSKLSPAVVASFNKNEIDIRKLSVIPEIPIYEDAWKEELSSKRKGEEFGRKLAATVSVGGTRCPKCRSTNTMSTSQQTRSADEGSTLFVQCKDCGTMSKM